MWVRRTREKNNQNECLRVKLIVNFETAVELSINSINSLNYTPSITINYTRVELMINSTLQTIAYFVLIQRVSN